MKKQDLSVSPMFSDHMVLQRDKEIVIWGNGSDDKCVCVTLAGRTVETRIQDHRWKVCMEPLSAGGPYTMEVVCEEECIRYQDVMIGEVWLAGGQSNMELELQGSDGGAEEIQTAGYEYIRFYNVIKAGVATAEVAAEQEKSPWKVARTEAVRDVSAVAYFCAKQLYRKLQIPIGVIDCYIGGTSVTCWMDEETLRKTAAGRDYIARYDQMIQGKTEEDYQEEMKEYNRLWKEWDDRVQEERRKNPAVTWEYLNEHAGTCPWPQPAGATAYFRPANPYHGMLERVIPYTVRGFWYYQGEEDTYQAESYGELFGQLIELWREKWQDAAAPFILNQLPMYIAKGEIDDKSWAVLRDQQERVSRRLPNVYMNVLIDCGEFDNIHPTDKKTVGERMAALCMEHVYRIDGISSDAPICQRAVREGQSVSVTYGGEALVGREESFPLFELAGEDGIFYPAEAELQTEHTVWVHCMEVLKPLYVRYAWTNYGKVALFDRNGLPAAPFLKQIQENSL